MGRRLQPSLAGVALALTLTACGGSAPPPATPTPAATPVAAAAPPPPTAPPPTAPNVADLVDARASSGESEMERRGFSVARQRGLTAYWWNASALACVQTVTANGRYRTVMPVARSNCGH